MRKTTLSLLLCILALPASAQEHPHHNTHQGPHHDAMEQGELTEAGNSIFATIQEVVRRLQQDPDTDWSKVDLEGLRQHLLDMKDIAENVEVVDQRRMPNGVTLVVAPPDHPCGRSPGEGAFCASGTASPGNRMGNDRRSPG